VVVSPVTKGGKTDYTIHFYGSLTLNLQVGSNSEDTFTFKIKTVNASTLGIYDIYVKDNDGSGALDGIDKVKEAIVRNSAERSNLGATQNRLEHTIRNLDNVVENTTAAESRIRDTDMASEIQLNSNAEILAQAGQAMMAQANQSKSGVLSLLK
jgi:flagellin